MPPDSLLPEAARIRCAMPESLGDLLRISAHRHRDRVALVFEDQHWTFRQLDEASSKLAGRLRALGLAAGEAVALYSPNCPEWIVCYYAAMKLGCVVAPLNLMLTPEEAAFAINDSQCVAVFGSDDRIAGLASVADKTGLRHRIAYGGKTPDRALDLRQLLEGPAGDVPPLGDVLDQPCTIGYTSGTTGHPKGAVLTHRGILMNVAMTATMHVRTSADTVVSALPCSHVYGNVVMHAALGYGMTLVLHKAFDADRVLQSIQDHHATMLEGVPTMYMYILNHPKLCDYDLSSLSRCTVGGQTMPEAKMRAVEAAFGCRLVELWGMTELGGLGTTHSCYGPTRLGSIGVPLPHMQARVMSTDGTPREMPAGEVGELQMRGPLTMQRYLGRPEATAETLIEGGWLRTGDLVRMDEEGYIYVVDRLKDMVITGGFNIYPAELERVIAEHPDVAMVAVGSVPHEEKGEIAKAYIVARQGATVDLDDVNRHCRERLAAYKVPRAYMVVPDLPKTSTGKILRRMLKTLDKN